MTTNKITTGKKIIINKNPNKIDGVNTFSLQEFLENEIDHIKNRKHGITVYEQFHKLLIGYRHDPEYNPTLDLIDCAQEIGMIEAYEEILSDINTGIYVIDRAKVEEWRNRIDKR